MIHDYISTKLRRLMVCLRDFKPAVISTLFVLLVATCLFGCQKEESIATETESMAPETEMSLTDLPLTTSSSPEQSEDDSSLDDSLDVSGNNFKKIDSKKYPDSDLTVQELPETVSAHYFCPSVEKVLEVLLPGYKMSDFKEYTQAFPDTNEATTTRYKTTFNETTFILSTLGESFHFDLDPETSNDLDLVFPLVADPFSSDTRALARDYFNDEEISIMKRDDAIAVARSALLRLGYDNLTLFEVTALNHEKILKKTLECKQLDEEMRKAEADPNRRYDFRLNWSEKDGKYAILFLCQGPCDVPVDHTTHVDDIDMLERNGSIIGCYVGEHGIETVRTTWFYKFDQPSETTIPILSREDIAKKVEEYYAMTPDVKEYGVIAIRLIYLPDFVQSGVKKPDTISLMPVYVANTWLDQGNLDEEGNPMFGTYPLYFDAKTGEIIQTN